MAAVSERGEGSNQHVGGIRMEPGFLRLKLILSLRSAPLSPSFPASARGPRFKGPCWSPAGVVSRVWVQVPTLEVGLQASIFFIFSVGQK